MKKIKELHPVGVVLLLLLVTAGIGFAVIQLPVLPENLVIIPTAIIIWMAFRYPKKWAYLAVAGYILVRFWVDIQKPNPTHGLWYSALTGIILVLLIYWLSVLVERHLAAERELISAKEHYKIIADYSEDLELWFAPDLKLIFISSSCQRITGYESSEFYQNPPLAIRIIHPEERKIIFQELQQKDRSPKLSEFRIIRKDGVERWVESSFVSVFRETGEFLGTRASLRDISDRKATEQELNTINQRLETVLEHLNEGLFELNLETQEVYLSPPIASTLGLPAGTVPIPETLLESREIFQSIFHVVNEDDFTGLFNALSSLAKGTTQREEVEFRITHKSRRIYWILCRAVISQFSGDGKPERIIGSLMDVSSQKAAEDALKQSEKSYRELIEQQGEGVVIADPNECILYSNPAGDLLFGESIGGLRGKYLTEYMDQDQIDILMQQTQRRYFNEEGSYELQINTRTGTRRQILITATPRFDKNNVYTETIGVLRDITSRAQEEKQLRYQSQYDALTDVQNRTFYEALLDKLEKGDLFPISIIMIDVDGLKKTNDEFGHHQGDELLKVVAKILKQSIRDKDYVARIGGDEFALLLPNVTPKELQMVKKRINYRVAELNASGKYRFTIEISLGGATSQDAMHFRSSLQLADTRMYRNKRTSRKLE